jgi:hypothetical protein
MMRAIDRTAVAFAALLFSMAALSDEHTQSSVAQNSNVVGTTLPGYYRGIPAMQDNEPSCAINPLLALNFICAWNASGGSDDPQGPGDTAIRMSETLDGGKTFFNRYINGTRLNPATSLGVQFTADPIALCWPGGCGILHIGADRGEAGGTGGGIYMQRMMDLNTEFGFRKALEPTPVQVYRTTGSKFADKVNGTYILDKDNPGTIEVSMDVERPDGSIETIVRYWPRARIIVTFALFNPSKNDIEILSMFTDDYGGSFSNPKQVAVTSGRDQGVSVTAIGNTVLYAFRVFEDDGQPSAMRGAISNDGGQRIGKPFDIVSPLCAYDVPTFPNSSNQNVAASRTNDFPSVSNNGEKFILTYSERRPSSDGGCFTTFDQPTDSRVKVIVGSANGKNWGTPIEVAPNPDMGFQFMPTVDCSLGQCQVAWWDSRFDTQRVRNYLENVSTSPPAVTEAALSAFLTYPVLADFNFNTGPNSVMQFRRTARVLTTRVVFNNAGKPTATDSPPVVVSQYRKALIDGAVREIEADGWNIKSYKTSSVPFMGDYSWITSIKQRLIFDPAQPEEPSFWEDNSSFDISNPDKQPEFWVSFISSRNVKGDIYTARATDVVPFARTPQASSSASTGKEQSESGEQPLAALSVEDFNPGAGTCTPVPNPGPGALFDSLDNRSKDFDIFGARIENLSSAYSFNTTKTYGSIQRAYSITAGNASTVAKTFRLDIANQPVGFPEAARASWDQLPLDPTFPDFATTPPNESETITVGPRSSEATALFVYSAADINPVSVHVYEILPDTTEVLINTITVNGAVESGPFLNANGTLNDFEIHNPKVYTPDEFNPDEFNPDEYNPDEFNPDLYTPDEFNPDEFNPDEFNPDEFNPDEFNPDEFNPDEFNPDEFNPDEFNPDEFNSPLTDPSKLDNPEIPDPELGDIDGLVVKLDINYGVQNIGNTITPYTVDFAVVDPVILDMIENGELATQLIAWQDKKIDDVQFCAPRIISENRVVAAVNNPDLATLAIPDIDNNRLGILTYVIGPGDVLQNTIRFIAPRSTMQQIAHRLTSKNIAYVFSSQVANTLSTNLNNDQERILNIPVVFNFQSGDTGTLEADVLGGARMPADFITASKGAVPVPVSCNIAPGVIIPLDILNSSNPGPTDLHCEATHDDETIAIDMLVSVLDTRSPTIDPTSIPGDIVAEVADPAGTPVMFSTPVADDADGVDPGVDVACSPASNDLFPFVFPGPTTTAVLCTATDDSLNTDTATFDVTIQDTSAPDIGGIDPPDFEPPLDRFVLDPGASTFRLFWGPIDVQDPDPDLDVSCNVGVLDLTRPLYTFVYSFGVGTTNVVCTASDSNGNSAMGSFDVTIYDEEAPVITLIGDDPITVDAGPGPYSDPGATATDNVDGDVSGSIQIDSSEVDTTTPGTYTVYITATDASNNEAQLTRTVIVEFAYPGWTGIIPTKTSVRIGSSNPLLWAWLDEYDNPINTSGDVQLLSIRNCATGDIVLQMAGDPGSSGFRYKSDNYWQFNWETAGEKGQRYCAVVRSSLTGQEQGSPPIRLR